jgi:serine/threonine-protein kinase RsbW
MPSASASHGAIEGAVDLPDTPVGDPLAGPSWDRASVTPGHGGIPAQKGGSDGVSATDDSTDGFTSGDPAAGGPDGAAGESELSWPVEPLDDGTGRDGPVTGDTDTVALRLPASGAYLSVLRTATAGLAARLDFTLDDIEDLRIAVDEACAMLLPEAKPGSDLVCIFELSAEAIGVQVSVASTAERTPSRDTFAWMVLSALAGDVDSTLSDGELGIRLLKRRQDRR